MVTQLIFGCRESSLPCTLQNEMTDYLKTDKMAHLGTYPLDSQSDKNIQSSKIMSSTPCT